MPTVVATDRLPAQQRAAAWRDAVCETFVRLECRHEGTGPIRGRIDARSDGELHVAQVMNTPLRVERSARHAARATEAFVLASLQLRGRTVVEQAGRRACITPGQLAFYDTARPYTLLMPESSDQFVIHLPRDAVESAVPGGVGSVAQVMEASNPFAQSLLALAPRLLGELETPNTGMQARTRATATDLLLLALDTLACRTHPCIGGADHVSEAAQASRASAHAEALAMRARELMIQGLCDPDLTPTRIAGSMRISLRRLQEVFQATGETPSECIRNLRLDQALLMLASVAHARRSIGAIAHQLGFADIAHFSRCFRSRFGCAPREHRHRSLATGSALPVDGDSASTRPKAW